MRPGLVLLKHGHSPLPLFNILTAHFTLNIFQPPRNYQPAVASEPSEPKAPPPRPPPPVQKTVGSSAVSLEKEHLRLCYF